MGMAGRRLVFALDEEAGEGLEIVGGGAEGFQGGEGVGDEIVGVGKGALDAEDGGPGGLGDGGVLAGCFAELGGVFGEIEDVIDDLKGEAGGLAEAAQAGDGVVGGAGDVTAGDDGDGDEGAGLGAVDLFDEGGGGGLAFGLDVDDLAADHAGGEAGREVVGEVVKVLGLAGGGGADAGADGAGDLAEDVDGGDSGAVEAGDGVEGEGLEGVAGEDGDGLAEDLVAGGLTAAEVVVVEGREVVVDERVGVEHFDGGAELDGGLFAHVVLAGEAPGLIAEVGAEPLAAGEDGVTHGAMDGVGCGVGRGKQTFQGEVSACSAVADQLENGGAHGVLILP